jgi:hypothetical protein
LELILSGTEGVFLVGLLAVAFAPKAKSSNKKTQKHQQL